VCVSQTTYSASVVRTQHKYVEIDIYKKISTLTITFHKSWLLNICSFHLTSLYYINHFTIQPVISFTHYFSKQWTLTRTASEKEMKQKHKHVWEERHSYKKGMQRNTRQCIKKAVAVKTKKRLSQGYFNSLHSLQ
jgi:hypothetical protein